MTKTLPDQIADLLLALIYIGDIAAHEKLPPERQLAQLLDVDRTSLRMALRMLGRMNAIQVQQGSGIRVADIQQDMGLDFLDNLYRIPELNLGGHLLLSGLDLFNRAVPTAIRMAIEQVGLPQQTGVSEHVKGLFSGLAAGENYRQLAQREVALIDTILIATQNPVLRAAAVSSRSIRIQVTHTLYGMIDVSEHYQAMVSLLRRTRSEQANINQVILDYQTYIDGLTQPLRAYFMNIPAEPSLRSSPLQNGRNIVSLKACLAERV